MKIILRYLLFSGVILFCGLVFSQKDYEAGYIILNNNDTLFGLVKDRKEPPFGKLHKKVFFKGKHGKKKYAPDQIIGYKRGEARFESHWLHISSYFFFEKYTSKKNFGKKEFLKVVLKGYLSYYQQEFIYDDSDYIDHIDLYKRVDENYFVRVTQGIFGVKKKSLSNYFKDCPELVEKIVNATLRSPVGIADYYNSWRLNNVGILYNK